METIIEKKFTELDDHVQLMIIDLSVIKLKLDESELTKKKLYSCFSNVNPLTKVTFKNDRPDKVSFDESTRAEFFVQLLKNFHFKK